LRSCQGSGTVWLGEGGRRGRVEAAHGRGFHTKVDTNLGANPGKSRDGNLNRGAGRNFEGELIRRRGRQLRRLGLEASGRLRRPTR